MAEIRPSEISEILKNEIKGFEGSISVRETGRVLSCGDGIARIYGLAERRARRAARISASDVRDGAEPRGRQRRRRALRRPAGHPGRRRGQAHRQNRRSAGRRRPARPRRQRTRSAHRRQGPDQIDRDAPHRDQGARHHPAPAGQGAAADRHQGYRHDARHRPRTARADHRRPPDRQDRDRHRHDHQSERPGRALLLRGDRAEALDRRAGGREAHQLGRDGVYHRRRRDRFGSRPAAVHRALQRMHDGRIFSRQRQACAAGVRRFEQARAGLSPVVAAAAPPAGPRGLSRRRLLSALAPARARRQDVRRDGRRLADRAAHHRDAGRRRLRLHPDQRHLDHRRPDHSRQGPVQLERAPRRQRRPVGFARRLLGRDQGDEAGRRHAQARPRAVPRDGGVRAVRLRPRRVVAAPARPRRAPDRDAQAESVQSAAGRKRSADHVRRERGLLRQALDRADSAVRDWDSTPSSTRATRTCSRKSGTRKRFPTIWRKRSRPDSTPTCSRSWPKTKRPRPPLRRSRDSARPWHHSRQSGAGSRRPNRPSKSRAR